MPESHELSDKLDYNQVTDHIFIGTNICCRTHFDEELLAKGVTVDISLEQERIDSAFGVDVFLWLPTPNNFPPSLQVMKLGAKTLKYLEGEGIISYVHCQFGHGRAPTLVAAFLVLEKGMSAEEAVAFIKSKRPVIHLESVQINALKELENARE